MAIAFFDLDRTVIARNSASSWIRRELRAGHVGPLWAARAVAFLAKYQLGLGELDDAVRGAVASLAGQERAPIEARTHAFYDEEVRHWMRPGALAAIARHRAQGDRLALLTSSSSFMAARAIADLGLDHALCNTFEVDAAGRFTGRTVGPLCYGTGKLLHAEAYAASVAETLDAATFYTDSYADLAVMEKVGTPVAVHPDPRLRRLALRRGWRIEDWGEPR